MTAAKTKTAAKKTAAKKAAPAEEQTETKVSNSAVPEKYKKRYGKSKNCGDEMAATLAATVRDEKGHVDPKALNAVGKANGINVPSRWGHLNLGMQRMNLGNVLRNRARNGEFVQIGEATWGEKGATKAA